MKDRLKECFGTEQIIQRFLASWCTLNLLIMLTTPDSFTNISYGFNKSAGLYAFALTMFFITFNSILTLTSIFTSHKSLDSWAFAISYAAFSTYLLTINTDIWFCFSMVVITAVALCFLLKDDKLGLSKLKVSKKLTVIFVVGGGITVCGIIAFTNCMRQLTYCTPNFDFGIFCNMFYYMKETFLPLTSCERDQIMSHFAVHISPIYYLILPFYAVFPSPYTLQIAQAVILGSGIIPLYLLAKHKGVSNKLIVLMCIAYSFNPVIISGTSYDLHENCFLVPLLLWMFYFYEREKFVSMYAFCVLAFLVKEDAALYVLFFGLFCIFSRKKYKHGIILTGVALVYFVSAVLLLTLIGGGVISMHFMNFMYNDNGLLGMIRIFIMNPGYVFTQTLSAEKLVYLLKVLLPLGFLPLCSKKVSQLLLLAPFLLENLMSSYVYQYSIDFQYTYGTIACMMYLAIINTPEISRHARRYLYSLAAVCSVFLFIVTGGNMIGKLIGRYNTGAEDYAAITEALSLLPENASVKSSTFFVPHIYERDEIYDIKSQNETDYVVFDMRPGLVDETAELRDEYYSMGYTVFYAEDGRILILQNPALSE